MAKFKVGDLIIVTTDRFKEEVSSNRFYFINKIDIKTPYGIWAGELNHNLFYLEKGEFIIINGRLKHKISQFYE